jgi:hypothetical protein
MAGGRAGHTEGSNRVTFTKASADRIAKAVRIVEQGNRDAVPFVGAPRIQAGGGQTIKKGTFTGDWDIGSTKTVTVCGGTQTAEVTNLSMHWMDNGTGTVLFSKACGTNSAIEISVDQCKNIGGSIAKIASFASSEVQILGHSASGCLQWYSITTCSTATTGGG